jgi:hypothetical protein
MYQYLVVGCKATQFHKFTALGEIVGTAGPVSVQLHALVPHVQSLTTGFGFETSDLAFHLGVGTSGGFEKGSTYSIGSHSSVFDSGIWDLNSSITVTAGQPYPYLFANGGL